VRKISLLVIVAFMAGCAALPPTIDRGEYQNYRYGFVVELPRDGWERTSVIPGPFTGYFSPEAPNRFLLLLHNPQTGGLIALQGGTLVLAYENVLTLEERLSELIQSFLDLEWFRVTGGDPRVRGSYRVYHCDASGLQWQEKEASRPMPGVLHASWGRVYPLKGETIGVTLYVFSRPDSFEENRKTLNRMAATLSTGEVFTTRVYGR
jgi:hypothetical protein